MPQVCERGFILFKTDSTFIASLHMIKIERNHEEEKTKSVTRTELSLTENSVLIFTVQRDRGEKTSVNSSLLHLLPPRFVLLYIPRRLL